MSNEDINFDIDANKKYTDKDIFDAIQSLKRKNFPKEKIISYFADRFSTSEDNILNMYNGKKPSNYLFRKVFGVLSISSLFYLIFLIITKNSNPDDIYMGLSLCMIPTVFLILSKGGFGDYIKTDGDGCLVTWTGIVTFLGSCYYLFSSLTLENCNDCFEVSLISFTFFIYCLSYIDYKRLAYLTQLSSIPNNSFMKTYLFGYFELKWRRLIRVIILPSILYIYFFIELVEDTNDFVSVAEYISDNPLISLFIILSVIFLTSWVVKPFVKNNRN